MKIEIKRRKTSFSLVLNLAEIYLLYAVIQETLTVLFYLRKD